MNTSDQQPFNSVYFSLLTSAEALPESNISPVPSLNLQPNNRGGTTKKIMNSSYKKLLGKPEKENQTGH